MLTVRRLTSGAGPVKAITSWKVSVSADMSSFPTVGEPIASFMGSGSSAARHCNLLRLVCTRCWGLHAANLALRCWLCSLRSWLACRGHGTTRLQVHQVVATVAALVCSVCKAAAIQGLCSQKAALAWTVHRRLQLNL